MAAWPGGAGASVPQPQLLEYGRDVGLYSLAVNPAGDRVLVAPFEFPPDGPRLDVFNAAPGSPFGPATRMTGPGGPLFDVVAAVGPDAATAIVGIPPARAGNIGDGVMARVRMPGASFGPAGTVTRSGDEPFVAFDLQGTATAVWVRHGDNRGSEDYIEESTRPSGGDWSAPVLISHEKRGAYAPQVAFDAAGEAIAVWKRSGSPTEAVAAKPRKTRRRFFDEIIAAIRPPGGGFGQPQVVSDPRFDTGEPSLSVNASGQAALVWVLNTRNDAHFRVGGAFRQPGRPFARPHFFTPARDDATGASVALDDHGRALITWRIAYRKAPPGVSGFWIETAIRPPGGPVGHPVRLSGPWGDIGELAIGPSGRGLVSWIYHGRRTDLLQARAANTAGGFGPPIEISPRGELDNLDSTIDANGAVTFVWTRLGRRGERLETTTLPAR